MALTSENEPEGNDTYQKANTIRLPEDQQKGYNRYRLATGILGLLCAALLLKVINLAVLKEGVNESQSSVNVTGIIREKNLLSKNLEETRAQVEQLQSQVKALEEKNKEQSLRIAKLGRCKSCPPDWVIMNNTCFYFPSGEGKGWEESKDDCVHRGANLVIVDTLEKQKFISAFLKGRHNTFSSNDGYWISLRDKVNKQSWTWISGSSLTEGYWIDGEPNNYGSKYEDCAATYSTYNPLKSWNDSSCSNRFRWICEKEATEIS